MNVPGPVEDPVGRPSLDDVVPDAPRRSTKRLVISGVVGVVIMVGVFALLFPKASSYEEALGNLRNFSSTWLLALIAAGIANIVLYPLTVIAAIPHFSYRHSFIQRQSGFLVSNALPGGGAFAVGTQYAILARYGVSSTAAAAAVSADAIWTYLLTLGFPALGVILLVIEGRSTAAYEVPAVIGAVVVVVSVLVIVRILRSDEGAARVGRFAERLAQPVFTRLGRTNPAIEASLIEFRRNASDLVSKRWHALTITNAMAQLTPFVVLLCAMGGLGSFPSPITWIELFAAYSIALLLTAFPLTPGGLGTVDAALVGLLVAFGADSSVAVAADLIWRLVWFLPQLIVGMVTMGIYLIGRRRGADVTKGMIGE